jgi:CheY-like chemotaxis protein
VVDGGGYDVTSSPNSLSAFEQIQAGTSFSLVVTDVGMPGAADGRELARFIMNTRPHIPIIVISGSGFSANDELEGRVVFLMKPFDPEALLATVAKALSAPPPKLAQTR